MSKLDEELAALVAEAGKAKVARARPAPFDAARASRLFDALVSGVRDPTPRPSKRPAPGFVVGPSEPPEGVAPEVDAVEGATDAEDPLDAAPPAELGESFDDSLDTTPPPAAPLPEVVEPESGRDDAVDFVEIDDASLAGASGSLGSSADMMFEDELEIEEIDELASQIEELASIAGGGGRLADSYQANSVSDSIDAFYAGIEVEEEPPGDDADEDQTAQIDLPSDHGSHPSNPPRRSVRSSVKKLFRK